MVARQVFQLVLAVGRRGEHGVDIRHRDRVHLVFEPREQLYKDASQHSRVLARAVVLERADLQLFGQNVQLELMQMRQHQAGHFQRIDRGEVPLDGQALTRRAQKAHIEPCVVCDERVLPLPRPREELGHRFVEVGRVRDRLIRNAGQFGDLLRDGLVRVDVGLETVLDRAVHHAAGRDLGDLLAGGIEAGGLEVEHDERAVERLGGLTAHDRKAVRIVDVIRLDAVDDLHVPDDILLLALLRVQRLGEGLRHTVVGDRHRAVAPLRRAAQQRCGGRHAVHRAHVGVQMQLDALHALSLVLPHGLFRLDDAGRLQNHLLGVGVVHHFALHGAVQAVFDFGSRVARLVRCEELGHAHRIRAVGHVECDLDVILAGFLAVDVLVVGKEYLALDGDHIVSRDRFVDRYDRVLHQLAEDQIVLAHLLRARTLVAGVLRLGRGARLFRLGLGRRSGSRFRDRLLQNLLAVGRVGRRGVVVRLGAHRVHRAHDIQLAPDARFQMAQGIGKMLFAHLIHRDV